MKKVILFALVLTLVSAAVLYAHDAWVVKEGNVLVVKYGHGNKIEPYKPSYVKGAKAYNASGKEMAVTIKPLGGKMELVPLKNPLSLKVGDKLPLQLLYNGKPLAGVAVKAEGYGKDKIKTDPNGRVEVVIKKNGFNIVGATNRTPTPNDPNADVLVESANFAFEVK